MSEMYSIISIQRN